MAIAVAAGVVPGLATRADGVDHLVISEIATGAASASDEFIEILNPSGVTMALDGLELVYASASGATISGRAAWAAGSPGIAPGGRVLVANEAGIHAAGGDFRYAGGMSSTAGSVVLRAAASGVVIDAVSWGAATGSWLEGTPAPPPAPGASIERLTSTDAAAQDTDDNAADFAVQAVPSPEGGGLVPMPTPLPSPSPASSETSPTTTPTHSLSPGPPVVAIAAARATSPLFLEAGAEAVPGRWLAILGLYDLVFGLLAYAIFDFLLEE
jgi:hypothetical protein